jgi:hypothetical protein
LTSEVKVIEGLKKMMFGRFAISLNEPGTKDKINN